MLIARLSKKITSLYRKTRQCVWVAVAGIRTEAKGKGTNVGGSKDERGVRKKTETAVQ